MPQPTLLDIAKLNGSDAVVGLIEENLTYAPEMSVFPSRTIRGTSYKIAVRTTLPGVSFRAANGGVIYTKSEFQNRLIEAFILSGNIRVDVAVAGAYEDGPEAFKAIEASGVMKQALLTIGSQIYYGTQGQLGFPGLQAIHAAYSATLSSPLTVNATGTTALTGSSVYGVKFGPQDVQLIWGQGLTFDMNDEWFKQMVNDGVAGQDFLAWVNALNAWVGLQVGSAYSVGRVKNLTAEVGKGLTDALLGQLLGQYPVGHRPDVWLMNRRSALQLQASRSATSVGNFGTRTSTGADIWAPYPTESNGIPIVVTDSIVSTEPIEA